MELFLMVGKWLFVVLVYLFLFLVYRGLIRQGMPAADQPARREEGPRTYHRESAPLRPRPAAPVRPQPMVPASPPPAAAPSAEAPAGAPTMPAGLRHALEEEPAAPAEAPAPLAETPDPAAETPIPTAEPAAPTAPRLAQLALGPEALEPDAPKLTVTHSQTPEIPVGSQYPLLAAATIGRADFNAVAVPDQFASMQHAIIFLQDGRRVLRDRGSTNGTMLNGRKVTGDMVLRDGDQITIGTTVLRYSQPDPDSR